MLCSFLLSSFLLDITGLVRFFRVTAFYGMKLEQCWGLLSFQNVYALEAVKDCMNAPKVDYRLISEAF